MEAPTRNDITEAIAKHLQPLRVEFDEIKVMPICGNKYLIFASLKPRKFLGFLLFKSRAKREATLEKISNACFQVLLSNHNYEIHITLKW